LKLIIIIPTYNEIENIEPLISSINATVPEANILVIDDNSPDGTGAVVERLAEHNSLLHILKRGGKQGGASAFLEGFAWGLNNGFDILLAMDADFSHDPKYIPIMLKEIANADLVIGSRNVPRGGIENRSWIRNILTKGGSIYCQAILKCPIKDITGGYNMWQKTTLEKIRLGSVVSRGYSFQIEMKYKAYRENCRIVEVPIIFPDRKKGQSKMSGSFLLKALGDVWKIKKNTDFGNGYAPFVHKKHRLISEFFKFGITGGLGSVTNLAIFFFLVDRAGLPEIPISILCFIIAGTQNYFLNHYWSFREQTENTNVSVKRWFFFLCTALLGLGINILVMYTIITNFTLPYKTIAQACGIGVGMICNFLTAKFIVFRKKNEFE
jgi:dolichol-phosphate mannosyltransferase